MDGFEGDGRRGIEIPPSDGFAVALFVNAEGKGVFLDTGDGAKVAFDSLEVVCCCVARKEERDGLALRTKFD